MWKILNQISLDFVFITSYFALIFWFDLAEL